MVLLCPLVVIWTCSAFRPRFLSFIFCFCFSFSPTDLHLYITVTGRVPSLNAPSIFTTLVTSTFVPNPFLHTHSHILEFFSFASSFSFSPLASFEPDRRRFALPTGSFDRLDTKARRVCGSRDRRVIACGEFPFPSRRGGGLE